ncbi:MAG: hypothetical protein IKA77_03165 [Clostridia bacterium]|nr:hypothetical protein [Clostridia bacterium]
MKKLLALVLVISVVALVCVGCAGDKGDNQTPNIFNNFTSTSAYTKATETLRLPSGTTVYSYDGTNDVFITSKTTTIIEGVTRTRYGFCSATQELIAPRFTQVMDIKGDYAIVVRTALINGQEVNHIGITKFRGENSGYELGFFYPYAPMITQFTFLNDKYLIVLGSKNDTEFTSAGYTHATIYDYASSNELLEVATIYGISNSTKFVCNDNYLAAVHSAKVDFYDLNKIDADGHFQRLYTVNLLKEEDGYPESGCKTDASYLGNGWFLVSTTYASEEMYDTYEIPILDDTEGKTYYTLIKSVRISMQSGKEFDAERVTLVANKYTDGQVRAISNMVNAEDYTETAKWQQPYMLPVLPTSALIQEGYSIVYYYYYYYTTSDHSTRSWATSFQVYDKDAVPLTASNLVLPVVYVDGYGLQTADPNFKLAMRDVGYHEYENGARKTLIPLTENNAFENSFIHNGVILSYEQRRSENGMVSFMGATKVDGTRVAQYEYDAISPFFGNYAMATKIGDLNEEDGSIKTQAFYRIAMDGTVTSVTDCYQMLNGTYISFSDKKYGLKSNAGFQLIPNKCERVSAVDYFFKDGKTFYTVIATEENGAGVIYALS